MSVDDNLKHLDRVVMIHRWPYWAAAVLVGLGAVLYSQLFNFLEARALSIFTFNPYLFFALSPLLFLLGQQLVRWLAPAAAGSGIPQVMAAVELLAHAPEKNVNRLVGGRIILAKVLSSAVVVLGGGAIGREGTTTQISASIFSFISQRFRFVRAYISHDKWIVTGAAAGPWADSCTRWRNSRAST